MKKIILIALAAFVLSSTTANAQLFRRAYRSCYGGSCAYRSGYAYASGCWTGQYYGGTIAPCEPTTDAPRQAAATFDRYYPCEPVSTVEPCAPRGEYEPIKASSGAVVYRSCPTGACPLKNGAGSAVATLLDRVNAFRAQYGLSALAYDSTLTGGAQYQAGFCAYRGALVHGSGAEILAQNSQGIETALNQWLNSPAHRALLLNPSYRFGGVAVHRDGSGRAWCAMRFR